MVRRLRPDILLLDLAMPKHPGLEALRDLSSPENASQVRVIVLTAAAEKGRSSKRYDSVLVQSC
jgi:CheY-like chemotaxis protein